jgi:DNA-binding CsgD family transcriptional regulator
VSVLDDAAALLGLPGERRADVLTEACLAQLRKGADPAVVRALCDLQELRVRDAERSVAARARRIDDVDRGLARLRSAGSSGLLVDRVCDELVRSCGLERVLLSRVEDGSWRPWMVNGVVQTEEWFAAWADRSIPLGEFVLETELLAERRPALVSDVDDPRVHPIIRAGHSQSYLVAPILAAGDVVGFFHADHGIGGPPCTEAEREVLWAFAEGFAHLYERTTLLERLRDQRERVRETLFVVDFTLQRLHESDVALTRADDEAQPEPIGRPGGLAELTAREREVLEVLATGATNQEIAERLVVSLATVKTHVKRVLAKLGVVNRSQAIGVLLDQR